MLLISSDIELRSGADLSAETVLIDLCLADWVIAFGQDHIALPRRLAVSIQIKLHRIDGGAHSDLLEGFSKDDLRRSVRIALRSAFSLRAQLAFNLRISSATHQLGPLLMTISLLKGVDSLLIGIFDMLNTSLLIETPR